MTVKIYKIELFTETYCRTNEMTKIFIAKNENCREFLNGAQNLPVYYNQTRSIEFHYLTITFFTLPTVFVQPSFFRSFFFFIYIVYAAFEEREKNVCRGETVKLRAICACSVVVVVVEKAVWPPVMMWEKCQTTAATTTMATTTTTTNSNDNHPIQRVCTLQFSKISHNPMIEFFSSSNFWFWKLEFEFQAMNNKNLSNHWT